MADEDAGLLRAIGMGHFIRGGSCETGAERIVVCCQQQRGCCSRFQHCKQVRLQPNEMNRMMSVVGVWLCHEGWTRYKACMLTLTFQHSKQRSGQVEGLPTRLPASNANKCVAYHSSHKHLKC